MKNRLIILSLCISFLFTGCASIDISNKQSEIIAEYAAGVLVKHSYVYKDKYEDLADQLDLPEEEETTTPAETESETESQTPEINPEDVTTTAHADEEETTTVNDYIWHAGDSLGLSSLTIKYKSYEITKEYPEGDDFAFAFDAEDGYTFIVVNLTLTNETAEDITVNNSDKKPAVRALINGNEIFLNYGNLMLNDITDLDNVTVKANSQYDGIVIFMVPESVAGSITSFKLSYDDKELTII